MSIWDKKEMAEEVGESSRSWTLINLALAVIGTAILLILGFVDLGLDEPPQIVLFLGRFHPVILHMPIGMLAAVIMLEFIGLLPKYKSMRCTSHVVLWMAAIFGFIAAVFGDFWGLEDGPSESLNEHQRMGTMASVFIIWLVGISSLRLGEKAKLPNIVYVIALLFTMAWMSSAAHHGANLTHGETHLTKHLPPYLEFARPILGHDEDEHEQGHGHHKHDNHDNHDNHDQDHDQGNHKNGTGNAPDNGEKVEPVAATYYVKHIHPIMMEYCESCHGDKKQKAKIKLNSYANMMKSETMVDPEAVEDCDLIYTMELPLDDDEHMPPEDEPQPSKQHIELLKAWIAAGAKEDSGPDPSQFELKS